MKKILSLLAVILCFAVLFTACNTAVEETTAAGGTDTTAEGTAADGDTATPESRPVVKLGLLKGPTGMGAAFLLDGDKNGTTQADYEVTLQGAPDALQASLINGELDMAALPTNVASVLNAKTGGKVQILAVNTLGVIYLMSNDPEIDTVSELEGKTILSAGKGTTTEYVLNYILESNSVNAEVEYASEHAEVISKAAAGGYDVILLPEPFVTQMKAQNAGFDVTIDLTKEWKALGGGELTMGCIAVRTEFAENNPDAVKAFLSDYEASVKAVNEDPEKAGAIIEEFDIAKAAIASKAIPNCNIVLLKGEEMKTSVSSYLTVLHSANPASVGTSLPSDSFYCTVG